MLAISVMASNMGKASGAVAADHSPTAMRATMLTTTNVALVSFSGQVATFTRESTKATRGMATGRCIGPTAAAIRASGLAEFSTVMVG